MLDIAYSWQGWVGFKPREAHNKASVPNTTRYYVLIASSGNYNIERRCRERMK